MIDNGKYTNVRPVRPPIVPVKAQAGAPKANSALQSRAEAKSVAESQQPVVEKKHPEPDSAFLMLARAEGRPVCATLKSGRCHIGKVILFGLYTVQLETPQDGYIVLYKSGLESLQYA
jgi:hypothetical protein